MDTPKQYDSISTTLVSIGVFLEELRAGGVLVVF